jgi:hypothetical protein
VVPGTQIQMQINCLLTDPIVQYDIPDSWKSQKNFNKHIHPLMYRLYAIDNQPLKFSIEFSQTLYNVVLNFHYLTSNETLSLFTTPNRMTLGLNIEQTNTCTDSTGLVFAPIEPVNEFVLQKNPKHLTKTNMETTASFQYDSANEINIEYTFPNPETEGNNPRFIYFSVESCT